jgi:nitrous oxidase accessory protein NosD
MWLNNNHGDTWVAVDDLMLGSGEFKELMNGHFVETQMGIHLVKEKIISILNSSKGNSFNTNEKE